jgi:galactokinase
MTTEPAHSKLTTRFKDAFAKQPRLWRGPGRINLIGEHVDYCGGPVMPGAISQSIMVAAAPNGRGLLRVQTPFGSDTFGLDRFERRGGWQDYIAGMAFALARSGYGQALEGMDMIIESDLPAGIGVSSSAALEVVAGLALTHGACTGPRLAQIAQIAENDFAGMPCGIMDQFASANGKAGHLMLLDCATLAFEHLAVPDQARIVLIDSGVKHTHVGGEYAARRKDCEAAAAALDVGQLSDLDSLEALVGLGGNQLKRARHVVSEIGRTRKALIALAGTDLAAVGELLNQSHASLSADMEVSTPEVDQLAALAQAAPGVFGARMMGGGFGGSVIALVDAAACTEAETWLAARWTSITGRPTMSLTASLSDGAGEVQL